MPTNIKNQIIPGHKSTVGAPKTMWNKGSPMPDKVTYDRYSSRAVKINKKVMVSSSTNKSKSMSR